METAYGRRVVEALTLVDVVRAPADTQGVNGLGTVHHVAFAVAGEDEQLVPQRGRKGSREAPAVLFVIELRTLHIYIAAA